MRKSMFLVAALAGAVMSAPAQVTFGGLDLSSKDRLLLSASIRSPVYGTWQTLFLADPRTRALRQLTFFPEEASLLEEGDVLQIRNAFGVFRSQPGLGRIDPVAIPPSFVMGGQVEPGALAPLASSPDGRWVAFVRARSAAHGDLVLEEVGTASETILATGVERSLREPAAIWSPDSRFLLYRKAGSLYYCSMAQLAQGPLPSEDLRRLGDGRMASVAWAADGTLHYVSGSILYAIEPTELFTRSLYHGFLSIGRVEGKIPFAFDPALDSFTVSPDGRFVLLDKGGTNIFLYRLSTGDFVSTGNPVGLPYLYLPRTASVRAVAWSRSNAITLLCATRQAGAPSTALFRLVPEPSGEFGPFVQATETDVRDLAPSPDGSKVALLRADGVTLKDTATWQDRGSIPHPDPLHVLWLSEDELLVAGAWRIERVALATGRTTLVALAQAEEYGHARQGEAVLAKTRGDAWSFDETAGTWRQASAWSIRASSTASASWRVFLEPSSRGSYRNLVMIRDAKGMGTTALLAPESLLFEPFPSQDQPVDLVNFSHGSRIRRREVALVFNAVDSADGLGSILDTLSARGLRCTFFLNGEFIRRFPDAAREIADSGHEIGSLFLRAFDMTDARFAVDQAFVKQGLAATEGQYFAATGREMSLFWHAPSYLVASDMIEAGRELGYTYVGRDLDPRDWVARSDTTEELGLYASAADLVERIVAEKRPGSIIPILIGAAEGRRQDYLFQQLDLLLDDLAALGYEIVPVSALIEHARQE